MGSRSENDKVPPDSQEQEPYLPLHRAAFAGRVVDVESIVVSVMSTISTTVKPRFIRQLNRVVIVKLVELGCNMNKTDNNGLTALHHAATEGHVDVVAKLIELRLTTRD